MSESPRRPERADPRRPERADPRRPERADPRRPEPLELWQAEWCPSSQRVRQRLTELGLCFMTRQVPAEREGRDELQALCETRTIPVLVDGGKAIAGEEAILAHLDAYQEPPGAQAHREKAQKVKQRQLEEACRKLEAATR
jgi:glutaredoxin